jgi:flagellum-specific peptidoglycan hydrolase FlgJ
LAEAYREPAHTKAETIVLYVAMRNAARALWNAEPSRACLLVLLAQWALETADGGAWMNWNVGGVKHRPGDGRDWTSYATKELEHGRFVVHSGKEDPATWFRAFSTMEEGIADYLVTLEHDFPKALERAHGGDAPGFVRELAAAHYFTAPQAQYLAGIYTTRDVAAAAAVAAAAIARVGIEQAALEHGGVDEQPTPPEDLDPPA